MKTRLLLLSFAFTSTVFSQGTVNFYNGSSAAVTNLLTMQRVTAGTTFLAALYCAADGVTDEAQFAQIGAATGFFAPGVFNGGIRTSTAAIPPGGWGMFQVRVFESAFGSSYEEVVANSNPIGGRIGLTGRSMIFRAKTGNPQTMPPGTPGSLLGTNGLRGFFIPDPVQPVAWVNVSDASVVEGNAGFTNLLFTVSVSGSGAGPISVDFATRGGTATPGVDYIATNGTIVFPWIPDPGVGTLSHVISIPVVGDAEIEPDETVSLILTNVQNAYAGRLGGIGTIRNDDCRTSVAFAWYPGVTIEGCVGKSYRIEVAEASPGPYTAVTNLVLPSSPYLWIDSISTLGPQRFYRTYLLPTGP